MKCTKPATRPVCDTTRKLRRGECGKRRELAMRSLSGALYAAIPWCGAPIAAQTFSWSR